MTGNNSFQGIEQELLPANYNYKILSFNDAGDIDDVNFDLEVRVNVSSAEGVKSFLEELYSSIGCSYNIKRGRPDKTKDAGGRSLSRVRGYRKCVFNVSKVKDASDKQAGKNTNCESHINFRLENVIGRAVNSCIGRELYPPWVKIHWH